MQNSCFNTQPPEGGWIIFDEHGDAVVKFQHTAARRRLVYFAYGSDFLLSFNTQPPEGGWLDFGGCCGGSSVSTHSRPKAAGHVADSLTEIRKVAFQHTAARRRLANFDFCR